MVEQVWAEGGGIAEVPPRHSIPIPNPPRIRFVLHSTGKQLLCHGSRPMVRGTHVVCVVVERDLMRTAAFVAEQRKR